VKKKWTVAGLVAFEAKIAKLFEQGGIRAPIHLSGGNELQLISIFELIKAEDWVFSTHRNHYHYLLKGGDERKLLWEIQGKKKGMCRGNGRSMNVIDPSIHFYSSAIVAGSCAIAVGVALGIKKRGENCKVWCFVGDGATDGGHFVEAVRFGMARELPLTFVVEDNDFSVDSSKKDRWHNYAPVEARNIIRYSYERKWPHVGCGKWVTF
jgi:pyruvate dehydrogenase E1 component alpha subunit